MNHINPSNRSESPSEHQFQLGFAVLLVVAAFTLRFAPLPENFGCFGAVSVFCGYVLRGGSKWILPLAGFFVADCVGHFLRTHGMGFYHLPTMILNYLGFASMIGAGALTQRFTSRSGSQMIPWSGMVVASVSGSALFFLISNFGAWLDPQMGYEKSTSGLLNCYLLGLPFFRATFISDLGFGCAFYALYRAARVAVLPYQISERLK